MPTDFGGHFFFNLQVQIIHELLGLGAGRSCQPN